MPTLLALLLSTALLAAALVFITNWIALLPWRRSAGKHWTERARQFHPARIAAAANLWAVPAVLAEIGLIWNSEALPAWPLVFFTGIIGAIIGTLPLEREIFPRIPLSQLTRQIIIGWTMRFLVWCIFLAAAWLMPYQFNYETILIVTAIILFLFLWARDGWLLVGRTLGIFEPVPERLQKIVAETSAKMNVQVSRTLLMRAGKAQAFAMPGKQYLLFTDRFLQLLPDPEIIAVCAHELGHLTESKSAHYRRYLAYLTWLPWLLFKPMIHTFGLPGFMILLANTWAMPCVCRAFSRRMEVRADEIAKANEPDPGVYASALLHLHQDGLVPAVMPKNNRTHPHLYDRMLAAGVTPDFPRPAVPASMSWNGHLFAGLVGALATAIVIRLTQLF